MILNILAMAKKYKQRPSSIIGIVDEYSAYCFDEACIFLYIALEEGKELNLDYNRGVKQNKHYKTISEYYKSLGVM